MLHIRPLKLVLIKKNQQLHSGYQYWNDNEAATDHGGVMADSCIRRMLLLDLPLSFSLHGLTIPVCIYYLFSYFFCTDLLNPLYSHHLSQHSHLCHAVTFAYRIASNFEINSLYRLINISVPKIPVTFILKVE